MLEYEILKDYDVLLKGDVLTQQLDGTFGVDRKDKSNGFTFTCSIRVAKAYLDKLVKAGVAADSCQLQKDAKAKQEKVESLKASIRLAQLNDKIEQFMQFSAYMRSTYEQDKLDVQESYTDGDVSVNEYKQAVTVYDNLIKYIDQSVKYFA